MPCANFAEDVGSRRRDQQQIDALRDGDMFDRAFDVGRRGILRAKHFGDDFLPGERGEGERRDEFLGRARHHHLHVELFLLQAAHELRGFVSRHSAGDAQCDLHGPARRLTPSAAFRPSLPAGLGEIGKFVFEKPLLQLFFGDARGLARTADYRPAGGR